MSIKFACCALVSTLFVVVSAPPLQAAQLAAYVSSTGSGTACTAAQPCARFFDAFNTLVKGGQISCLNSPTLTSDTGDFFFGAGLSMVIDCVGVYAQALSGTALLFSGPNQVIKIRNLTFSGSGGTFPGIQVTGSGSLILENCVFENMSGTELDLEPTGPLNLVIKNSRISNGSTVAIVLKPAAGGSINATFDQVTVTANGGGGIRLDTTNGPVTADVTDSVITNNTGNGLSAQGGAGGAAMLSIHNSVIAKNGAAGVNATGTNGAALVDMTLLDSNGSAISATAGGRIVTYGNNRIVGPAGSGFTGPVALQ